MINESSKYDELGVGGISNYDNANPKQLKWELDQDDFGKRGGGGRSKRGKKQQIGGKLKKKSEKNYSKKQPVGRVKKATNSKKTTKISKSKTAKRK